MSSTEAIRTAALAHELRGSSIFSGLGMGELLQIAGYSERMVMKRNQLLFREGDPVIGFYVVIRGAIKAYRLNEAGREQVIHIIRAGGSFAEPAVAGLPGYPAHTRALEATEVVLIRSQPFLAHLRVNSDLALRMLASLSRHLHELVTAIDGYRLRDAETRLLHWLLGQAGQELAAVGVLIVGVVGFLVLLRKHQAIKRERDLAHQLAFINEDESARLRRQYRRPETGELFASATHPYAGDLDVFGTHSLFRLLN
ncbi:MAG: Crp/Fnr family transcriptional regulator, partial [Verrucomicrobiaceae bacterium]